jgi:cobalt-zinc-cadmium efflux system outer membrane protein
MKRPLAAAFSVVLILIAPAASRAQPPPPPPPPPAAPPPAPAGVLRLDAFLAEVGRSNLEIAAQRSSVAVAEAQIAVARVFNDPTLTAGVASVDLTRQGSPTATYLGLGYTFELGGKRGARIAAATIEHEGARADLDDFLRNLRANAAGAFIDGLYARLVLDRKQQTLKGLERLVAVNEERLRAGDVGKVAITQSRVEAQRFRGEVLSAEADVAAADLALSLYLGARGSKVTPAGDLRIKPRAFDADALIAQALASRPDVASKRKATEGAAARVDLARANRWIDLTVNVSWQHSFPGTGGFLQPAFDALGATATFPLPFSKVYRGELDAAIATQAQSRTAVEAAELRVEVEIRQAHARYVAAAAKLGLYTGGLLSDADQVLEATLYNYQKGGATMLEVLEAQRTVNDVYLAYAGALADHAKALVALEQAAGMWDVAL